MTISSPFFSLSSLQFFSSYFFRTLLELAPSCWCFGKKLPILLPARIWSNCKLLPRRACQKNLPLRPSSRLRDWRTRPLCLPNRILVGLLKPTVLPPLSRLPKFESESPKREFSEIIQKLQQKKMLRVLHLDIETSTRSSRGISETAKRHRVPVSYPECSDIVCNTDIDMHALIKPQKHRILAGMGILSRMN